MESAPQYDPAHLPLVTFDNNALLAVRNHEPDAPAMQELLDLGRAGLIALNVTVSTAMEARPRMNALSDADRITWIESLGIGREHIFTHQRSIGFQTSSAPDTMTFDPRLEIALSRHIHEIFHPEIPYLWWEYRHRECERQHLTDLQKQAILELDDLRFGPMRIPPRPTLGLDALSSDERNELETLLQRLSRHWFNAKCDSEGIHIHLTLAWHTPCPEHAVFVTSDRRLRSAWRHADLRALGYRGHILAPVEAVTFLRAVTCMGNQAEVTASAGQGTTAGA